MALTPEEEARIARLEQQVASLEGMARFVDDHFDVRGWGGEDSLQVLNTGKDGRVWIQSAGAAILSSNAIYAPNGGTVRYDETRGSGLLTVDDVGVLYGSEGAGSGALTWTGADYLLVSTAPTTDANGWLIHARLGGYNRLWTKAFTGIALNAAVSQALITGQALPVGVSTHADAQIYLTWRTSAGAYQINCVVEGTSASATLRVTAGTINGANLSAVAATLDLFVLVVEV